MSCEEHYKHLVSVIKNLNLKNITVMVGRNGSGKSLIGSQLAFKVRRELNHSLPHASMRLRTESNASMGALSSMCQDLGHLATSFNTISMIKNVVEMVINGNKKYLVIDEPEIGIGEELLLGLIDYLNEKIEVFREKGIGCLIITHRRDVVRLLKKDAFVDLDGKTEEEWVNRPTIKRSIEEFEKDANDLFEFIQNKEK